MTKPIAPDTLIERLRIQARRTRSGYSELPRDACVELDEAADQLEANNRQLQLCREALEYCDAFFTDGSPPQIIPRVREKIGKARASIEGVGE